MAVHKCPLCAVSFKYCPSCKRERLAADFSKDAGRADKLQAYCSRCWAAYHRGIPFGTQPPVKKEDPK